MLEVRFHRALGKVRSSVGCCGKELDYRLVFAVSMDSVPRHREAKTRVVMARTPPCARARSPLKRAKAGRGSVLHSAFRIAVLRFLLQ